MNQRQYKLIKALDDGIVAVELKNNTNYKVGDIYHLSPTIKSIVKKVYYYKDYHGCKTLLRVELI